MRKPDPIKSDLVREEILRAAQGLFRSYGLDKTTMENIAEAAGKGKSTLYYYFEKKEDVFYAVACLERAAALLEIEKAVEAAHCAPERLRIFFNVRRKIIAAKAKLYPLIFKETKKHLDFFQKMRCESNMGEVNLFKRILLEGIASGKFSSIKKEECETIAITAISSLHGMDLGLMLDGKIPSENDRTEMLMNIFMRGLK